MTGLVQFFRLVVNNFARNDDGASIVKSSCSSCHFDSIDILHDHISSQCNIESYVILSSYVNKEHTVRLAVTKEFTA